MESELIKMNVIPDNIFSFLQLTNENFYGRICVQSDSSISSESMIGSTSERNTSNEIMVDMGEPSYNFTINNNSKVMQSAKNVKKGPLEMDSKSN